MFKVPYISSLVNLAFSNIMQKDLTSNIFIQTLNSRLYGSTWQCITWSHGVGTFVSAPALWSPIIRYHVLLMA